MTASPHLSLDSVPFPSDWVPLRAGSLTLAYDPAQASLRRIFRGRHEVIRGIYAAVRDQDWQTIPAVIHEHRREISPDSFRIEFEAQHHAGDIHFQWQGTLLGTTTGIIECTFDGEALSSFLKNRIGFCVLHPIRECSGAPARQTRLDGTIVDCRFPELIEPQIVGQSSFRDLRAVAHQVVPGAWAEVAFEGEVFEMEDQRNWTDASFKTYGTPLALPFPVPIHSGTRLHQRVTLRQIDPPPPDASTPPQPAEFPRLDSAFPLPPSPSLGLPLPRWGLGIASHGRPLTRPEVERIRALTPTCLRVDIRTSRPYWPAELERAGIEAADLGAELELALHLPALGDPNVGDLASHLRKLPAPIVRLLALRDGEPATSPATLATIRQALPGCPFPIGGGTDAHFCELNREQALGRFPLSDVDFLFWPITPQVHASDDASILENLDAQTATLATARSFASRKPCVISPITLKPRFNAVATAAPSQCLDAPHTLPPSVDPRQRTAFAAAWTAGTLAAMTQAHAESLTFFETTGWNGITESDCGPRNPSLFPSSPGECFPVLHLFAALREFRICIDISYTGPLTSLTLSGPADRHRTLFVNLSDQPISLLRSHRGQAVVETGQRGVAASWPLSPVPTQALTAKPEHSVEGLDGSPLLLGPYAVRVVDHRPTAPPTS